MVDSTKPTTMGAMQLDIKGTPMPAKTPLNLKARLEGLKKNQE